MHPRILVCILVVLLVITVPVFAQSVPVRGGITAAPSPTPAPVQVLRTIPMTTVTPQPTASCVSPCQCLERTQAVAMWGEAGFNQCSELPCEVTRSVTGAPVTKYCFQPKTAAVTTTPVPFQAPTTPANQLAPTRPTTSPTPFSITPTTPIAVIATATPPVPALSTIIRPLVIGTGLTKKVMIVGSDSPYFASMSKKDWSDTPLTAIEIDSFNTAKLYFGMNGQFYSPPDWVDEKTVTIEKTAKDFDVNFRYVTWDKSVTAVVWQVSRYPFPNDPDHWQNKYLPGLVASGPVKVYHDDADGYQYFVINFARIARHNAGDPPYFDGVASINQDPQGVGMVQGEVKIPFTSTAIVTKEVNVGLFTFGVPSGLITIPAGEYTQAELSNVNDGQSLLCSDCLDLRPPGGVESALSDMDQKYYVRVVPVHAGNSAGIPAIPVTVMVSRPHPCPSPNQDVVVKPPSAQVLWYMQPNFYVNPGTDASYHWYFVKADQFHPPGVHTYEPPVAEDKAWYEKVEDFFGSVVDYFSDMMTGMAEAWNALEDLYVGFTAKILTYTLTFGAYHCEDHSECTGALKVGLQAVMVAYGVPPTLPTGPELMSLSTDYLVELGADQLGAGEVVDFYKDLPDDAKIKLNNNPKIVSTELMNSQKEGMDNASQQAYCRDFPNPLNNVDKSQPATVTFCNYKIPDPIFNAVHPATVMVWVSNPNAGTSDRMSLEITDSMNLYYKATATVPPIEGGKGFGVPVVLTENYAQFKKANGGVCDPNAPTVTLENGGQVGLPCPQEQWMELWKSGWVYGQYHPPPDTFTVTFATGPTSCDTGSCPVTTGLTGQSSGKLLNTVLVVDPGTGTCPTNKYLRYPPGWQMTTQGKDVASFTTTWDPDMFTQSTGPNLGMLRNSP